MKRRVEVFRSFTLEFHNRASSGVLNVSGSSTSSTHFQRRGFSSFLPNVVSEVVGGGCFWNLCMSKRGWTWVCRLSSVGEKDSTLSNQIKCSILRESVRNESEEGWRG